MWVPKSIEELERAVRAGDVTEGPALDGKRELPPAGKMERVAVDVAAMSVEGGVLLIGVGESGGGVLSELAPLTLAGAAERIDQAVGASIAERPTVRIHELRREPEDEAGYLVVEVPPSPRAPHQVQTKGEGRYYGRGATGNRVLSEGEVSRLYRIREERSIDRDAFLNEFAGGTTLKAGAGYLHAFARPVAFEGDMWARLDDNPSALPGVFEQIGAAGRRSRRPPGYVPDLATLAGWRRYGGDAWAVEERRDPRPPRLRCELHVDGSTYLSCSRAAEWRLNGPDGLPPVEGAPRQMIVFEQIVAGNLASFFAVTNAYFEAASYRSAVDVGVKVSGIAGAISSIRAGQWDADPAPFRAGSFARTRLIEPGGLADPEGVARGLLQHFFDALVGTGYDPYA